MKLGTRSLGSIISPSKRRKLGLEVRTDVVLVAGHHTALATTFVAPLSMRLWVPPLLLMADNFGIFFSLKSLIAEVELAEVAESAVLVAVETLESGVKSVRGLKYLVGNGEGAGEDAVITNELSAGDESSGPGVRLHVDSALALALNPNPRPELRLELLPPPPVSVLPGLPSPS